MGRIGVKTASLQRFTMRQFWPFFDLHCFATVILSCNQEPIFTLFSVYKSAALPLSETRFTSTIG